MNLIQLFVFVILMALISSPIERRLREKLNVQRKKGWFVHFVHPSQIVLEIFLLFLFIFSFFRYWDEHTLLIVFAFLIALDFLRAFMHWKFERSSREWVIHLIYASFITILFILLFFLRVF